MPLDTTATTKNAALRVWWVPQIPMPAFRVDVADLAQAKLLLDALADYDLFQLHHRIKPDFCNAGGLEVFEDGEWSDWYHPETGDDLDDHMRAQAE